jgi:hypothetical protein
MDYTKHVCKNPYCHVKETHRHGISCSDDCSTCGEDFPFEDDDLEDREDY